MGNILNKILWSINAETFSIVGNILIKILSRINAKRFSIESSSKKSTVISSSSSSSGNGMQQYYYIPEEVISEILIRTPIKSLLRMKTVSKHWHAIINDRYFLVKHMIDHCPLNRISDISFNGETFESNGGRDGLVLWKSKNTTCSKYLIQNPATKQSVILPDPHHKDYPRIIFIFVASVNEYKLVNIYHNGDDVYDGCELLTLGSDKSWRPLITFPKLWFHNLKQAEDKISVIMADGALHFIRVSSSNMCKEIVSLDSESETFTSAAVLPQVLFSNWTQIWTLCWNGVLAFAHMEQGNFHILVLKDYKTLKWDKEIIIVLPLDSCFKEKPTSFGEFLPHSAYYGHFHFSLTAHGTFSYNIASKQIVKIFPLTTWDYSRHPNFTFLTFVSLITFRGMDHM